jgi:ATP-dependent protease ClpP protease subunit
MTVTTARLTALMKRVRRDHPSARITDRVIRPLRVEADSERAVLYVYDYIGMWGVESDDFVRAVDAVTAPTIELRVNSPGGDYFDAVAMYAALIRSPARIEASIDGRAASAASFLVMAADRITAITPAKMMIHDASTITYGDEADHIESAELLGQVSDTIAELYAGRAGGDPADWRQTMRTGRWYSSGEALDAGLIDHVEQPPQPPAGGTTNARSQAIRARARRRGVRT